MYATVASRTEEATVRACWRQWRALKGEGLVAGERPAQAIIDPEALVLASLAMRHREQRLRDVLWWWAHRGARLLSVQRLKTIQTAFPEAMLQGGVGWFASVAMTAGDARWKKLAGGNTSEETARTGKGPVELHLLEPSTLMLRLRAGFGVGAKADLMAFLIGASSALQQKGIWATESVMSKAVSYSRASVARAAAEMSLARFIEASADRPPMYTLDEDAWAGVLRLWDPYRPAKNAVLSEASAPFDIPPWRFWSHAFGFLVATHTWAQEASQSQVAPVVNASRARDIVERFKPYLAWSRLPIPDSRLHVGEQYLDPFSTLVDEVLQRVDREL